MKRSRAPNRSAAARVTIASRIYLPEPAAASFRLSQLADALAERSAHVVVMTTTAPRRMRPATLSRPGVSVSRFPVLRDREGYVRGYLQYLSFDLPLVVRLLVERRPDIVVCEPPPTTGLVVLAICAMRRVPYVYYAADVWSDASLAAGAPRAVVRLLSRVEGAVVRRAAGVLTVSQHMVERLSAWRQSDVLSVGHGVDTSLFHQDGPIPEQGSPYFLYAGTASEVHGALVFIDAFRRCSAEHPDARLVFAGQGTDFGRVRAAAAELPPGALTVLPRMSAAETAAWMRGATATLASVDPNADYDYAVPTKALASLACGTRVLLAGPSPLADAVRVDDLGWAVPHDVGSVAAAMSAALDSPPDAATAARLASWAATHASSDRVASDAAQFILALSGTESMSMRESAGHHGQRSGW